MTAALVAPVPAVAAGGSGSVKISKIVVEAGNIFIKASCIQNPDGCATADYIVIPADTPKQDHFLSVALTAQTTGRSVGFWLIGCVSTNWHASAPKAVSMFLPT